MFCEPDSPFLKCKECTNLSLKLSLSILQLSITKPNILLCWYSMLILVCRIEIVREGEDFDSLEITNATQPKLTTTASTPVVKPSTTTQPSATATVNAARPTTLKVTTPGSNISITTTASRAKRRRRRGVQVENLPLLEKKLNRTFFYTKVKSKSLGKCERYKWV